MVYILIVVVMILSCIVVIFMLAKSYINYYPNTYTTRNSNQTYDNGGCPQKWSYNYDKLANKDNKTCINITVFLNLLTILSSQKRSIVTINDQLVIDGDTSKRGLTVILIEKNDGLFVKDVKSFDIGVSYDEMVNMAKYLQSVKDEIVIILSRGETFNLFDTKSESNMRIINSLLNELNRFGMKNTYFDKQTNYILIGSRAYDLYFESASTDDIYFPKVEMIDHICKLNTAIANPPNEYYFYRDQQTDEDYKTKCALEANRKGFTSFAIDRDNCIPLSDDQWYKLKQTPDSGNCDDGLGSFNAYSGYKFKRDIYPNTGVGVSMFRDVDFNGELFVLNEGVHSVSSVGQVKSVSVPDKYAVYLEYNDKSTVSLFGEIKTNINDYGLKSVTVQKIFKKRAVLCDDGGKSSCYVIGAGKTTLPGHLYRKINYINVSPDVNRITTYEDSSFVNQLNEFDTYLGNSIQNIEYPRIVRSIRVD